MSENSQCWIIVCYRYHDGHKIWAYGMLYYQVPLSAGEFSSKVALLGLFRVPSYTCQPHVFIGKKSPHAEEVWWAHWSLWKIKKKLGATSSEFLWSKSSQLSWNFAAFVIYKSPQNRQEIDKLLPLGARWIPATSNQWMIFSQSMFSEQFRWSILPKSQPEEAQETARNARNPWENWWFLYLSCFRSQF